MPTTVSAARRSPPASATDHGHDRAARAERRDEAHRTGGEAGVESPTPERPEDAGADAPPDAVRLQLEAAGDDDRRDEHEPDRLAPRQHPEHDDAPRGQAAEEVRRAPDDRGEEAEGDRAQTGVAVRSQGRMSRSAPRIARVAGERFRV